MKNETSTDRTKLCGMLEKLIIKQNDLNQSKIIKDLKLSIECLRNNETEMTLF